MFYIVTQNGDSFRGIKGTIRALDHNEALDILVEKMKLRGFQDIHVEHLQVFFSFSADADEYDRLGYERVELYPDPSNRMISEPITRTHCFSLHSADRFEY